MSLFDDLLAEVRAIAADVTRHGELLEFLEGAAGQLDISIPDGSTPLAYSGQGAGTLASDLVDRTSSATGSVRLSTINITEVGRFLLHADVESAARDAGLVGPGIEDSPLFAATTGPWAIASERYAGVASGDVIAIVQNADPSRTFALVELEALLANDAVNSINGIDRNDLAAMSLDQALDKVKMEAPAAELNLINRHFFYGNISSSEYFSFIDKALPSGSSSPLWLNVLTQEDLDSYDASVVSRLGIDTTLIKSFYIGSAIEVLRQAGIIGDVVSFIAVSAQAAQYYEEDNTAAANELWVAYLFETAGGLTGGVLGALIGARGGLAGSILGGVGFGLAGSVIGADKGAAIYQAYPELFDALLSPIQAAVQSNESGDDYDTALLNAVFAALGFDGSSLDGGSGNDFLLAPKFGEVNGNGGDDVLVSFSAQIIRGGELINPDNPNGPTASHDLKLYMNGGAGDDWIVAWDAEGAVIDAGDGDDTIVAFNNSDPHDSPTLGQEADEMIIDAGGGDDWVASFGAAKINLGAGDDVLLHAGKGSEITTGAGSDTLLYSRGTAVTDADASDTVLAYKVLDAGGLYLRNGLSESPYAYGKFFLKVGFNDAGEMALGDAFSENDDPESFMYFMNATNDPFAPSEDRTAGIRVAELELDNFLLVEKPAGISARSTDIWKLVAQLVRDVVYDAKVARSDPLVLDLDGDGIELIDVLSPGIGANFDIDGDGFAEPTGWVGGDDGMLAVDTNSNGLIDDVDELFGKGSTSGYSELAAYDTNTDGVVDALDTNFADLLIWQDANGDAVTDAGELKTLTEWGITSISLTYQDTDTQVSDNIIARTGTFTFVDGSTGTMGDVDFSVNNFNSTYLGDNTVDPLLTQNLPNLKGYGTLTDLHVALTLDGQGGALASAINADLASLAVFDMATMRANALPILQAWANAVPVPTTGGNTDVAVLMNASGGGRATVSNFAILVTENIPDGNGGMVSSTHYKLVGGGAIVDGNGAVIVAPTLADIMGQATGDPDLTWETLTGAEIDFMERFMGEDMPIDVFADFTTLSIGGLSNLIGQLHQQMELLSLRLAMQGPLEPYFTGIEYDPVDDVFRPTTNAQLVPMLETIFAATPSSTAQDWLEGWTPLLRAMLADYDRGEAYLVISRPFLFTNIVAAYENVPPSGIGLEQAAVALGMPAEMLNFGTGVRDGTSDVDMFYMGTGDDIARGGSGGDVYVFGRDFGSDRIEDFQQNGTSFDTIRFAHLNAADIEATRIGLDLRLTEIGTANTVLIKNQFHELFPSLTGANLNPDEAIEEIVFADGSVWTTIDIAKAVSKPDVTDQTIIGTDHVDFLDGGAGNDYLSGGDNLDFYFFDVGYGQDIVEDARENVLLEQTDVLMLGAGITRDNIQFNRVADSLDLIISIAGATDTLTILGQFDAFYSGPFGLQWFDRIENFQFDDGFSMGWSEVVDALLDQLSTDGDDIIYGVARDDRLDGGAGNDILSGGEESDTYIFGYGYGNDIIREGQEIFISNGYDEVIFNADVSLGDLTFSRVGNSDDLTIGLAGSTDTLTIEKQFDVFYAGPFGKLKFDRVEGFKFAGDPLTSLTWNMITEQVMAEAKTSGADIIYGFDYEDVLDGGAGNDWLSGGSENDTYIFGVGYGQDIIFEGSENNLLSGQDDKVVFNGTLLASDVTFSRQAGNYDDLFIDINATADRLTIQDTFETATLANGVFDVEAYHFTDGTILTLNDVQDILLTANTTAGNDTTIGFRRDDVIEASAGDDFLNGWHGNDTYKFGVGSGNDTIHEDNIFVIMNEADRVEFGPDITEADLVVTRDGNNAVISHINGQDSITIIDQHRSIVVDQYMYAIESFVFADGTVWSDADLRAQTLVSTSQADTLIGYATADILDGGAGDDRLEGGSGGDTYVMGLGYGADTILETPATGGFTYAPDKVVFGPGIIPADLTVTQTLDDLIITIGSGGDSLTIEQFFASTANEVEEFHFNNGVIWFRAEIDAALANTSVPLPTPTVSGTIAGETISGTNSDDIILGDQGDDIISGLAGNDVYVYRLGDGADTIKDLYYQGSLDELVLGAGITPESVGLVRGLVDREDLTLTFSDGGSILLDEQLYQIGTPGVDIIKFQNGVVWQASALKAMVLAASQTDLDDIVVGYGSDDTLDGGLGNDTLEGLAGSDTYVYELGDGNDTIVEKFNHAGTDTLAFGAGITMADLTFVRGSSDFDDLTLQIAGGGSVFLDEQFFQSGTPGIEAITFHDGSSLDLAAIRLATLAASTTSGNETTYGFANSADAMSGSLGNDVLRGRSGDDTYFYDLGDGHDQIYEGSTEGTADRLIFGEGITASNVTLDLGLSYLYDLTFHFTDGGSLLLDLQRSNSGAVGVEFIEFADGTLWTDADIMRFVGQVGTLADETMTGTVDVDRLIGDAGNDSLFGNDGDDLIDFGTGNDTATGGLGNDTFIFKAGYGADTITDFEAGAGVGDVVEFQNSLAADYAALQAFMDDFGGPDTVIDFGGGDSLTLQGITLTDLHADDFRFVA